MTISAEGFKILSFYRDAQKLRRGEMIIPRFISLWLTTGCDLDCIYCWCKKANRQYKLADTASVKRLIDEIAVLGVEGLEFGGGGEPTLHPDCFAIAEYAQEKGLRIGLLTNGFRFDFARLSCFHFVRISLEAHTSEVYQAVKRGTPGRFRETLTLIRQLIETRRKRMTNRPRIGLKFMLCEPNWRYINQMADLSSGLGVDYCEFKPAHSCPDGVGLTPEDIIMGWAEIQRQKDLSPGFVYGNAHAFIKTTRCFLSPIHTVIMPGGETLACCFFPGPENIIGNAFEQGFAPIWYADRHWQAIMSIPEDDCGKVDCRWHYYNAEMLKILDEGEYDLAFI